MRQTKLKQKRIYNTWRQVQDFGVLGHDCHWKISGRNSQNNSQRQRRENKSIPY
jgi:hypothetical protein